jgi:hypothetical protein
MSQPTLRYRELLDTVHKVTWQIIHFNDVKNTSADCFYVWAENQQVIPL